MSDNLPDVAAQSMPVIASAEMTIEDLVARVAKVRRAIREVMVPGQDLIKVPGVDKPVAGKSCAEKLAMLFMLAPTFELRETVDSDGHLEVITTCTLTHIPTGRVVANGQGSCSSRESKYRYRNADRVCPGCGKAAIIVGKKEYGGGFVCFAKKGGCGAKYAEKDPAIIGQVTGRVENPDIADTFNTVRKMSQKRAYVGTVLMGTGASDVVTQDLEEGATESLPADVTPPQDMMPQSKPAEPPSGSSPIRVKIVAVDEATGTGKPTKNPDGSEKPGKPWKRYGIKVAFPDGSEQTVGTFSGTFGDLAKSLIGKPALVAAEPDANGRVNLVSISAAPASEDVPF